MNALAAIRALGPVDLRNVMRDPLLRWMALLPIAIALLVRVLMPLILASLSRLIEFDLKPHFEPLMGFVLLLMAPNITGIVIGFLLLDQRDDGTLSALQVTPLSLKGYLAWRLTTPMAVSFAITPFLFPIAGLTDFPVGPLLLAVITAAPMAPILALFLVCFARNKVQGFALMKAGGVVMWPPLAAYFLSGAWRLAIAPFPPFWAGMILWTGLEGSTSYWIYAPAGLAWQALLLWLLVRRFMTVMHRT